MKWHTKWIIHELRIWNQVKLWSSQLWTQFLQLRKETWKIQDFNGVWTRDLVIPVRRYNQLSYEATDVGSWSFVGSNVPVRNAWKFQDFNLNDFSLNFSGFFTNCKNCVHNCEDHSFTWYKYHVNTIRSCLQYQTKAGYDSCYTTDNMRNLLESAGN